MQTLVRILAGNEISLFKGGLSELRYLPPFAFHWMALGLTMSNGVDAETAIEIIPYMHAYLNISKNRWKIASESIERCNQPFGQAAYSL
jgi:hypothetical protein